MGKVLKFPTKSKVAVDRAFQKLVDAPVPDFSMFDDISKADQDVIAMFEGTVLKSNPITKKEIKEGMDEMFNRGQARPTFKHLNKYTKVLEQAMKLYSTNHITAEEFLTVFSRFISQVSAEIK